MAEIDEGPLVERARRGDTEAFRDLVDAYQRPVYNLALRVTGNAEDARDVAQVAFVKAWQKLETYNGESRFFSWVYRITLNEALNSRSRRRDVRELDPRMPSREPGPEERHERDREDSEVQAALLELKSEDREVLVMRHFLQLSHREMGEVLRVPDKTVKSRLHTARMRLEAVLRRRGFGTP